MKRFCLLILTCAISLINAQDYEPQISFNNYDNTMRVVTKNGLNLRSHPGLTGKLLTIVPFGATVWVRPSAQHLAEIDGRTGHWVRIDFEKFSGWAFDGYLGRREMEINPGFSGFKGGCTGVGCIACGALVFDPDGYFIESHDCHRQNARLGRWQVQESELKVCLGTECDPTKPETAYKIFSINKSGRLYVREKGHKVSFDKSWVKWEPGGWPEAKGRNKALKPLD